MIIWFQGDHHWGKTVHAQVVQSSVLYGKCLKTFSHNAPQLLPKICLPFNKYEISTSSRKLSTFILPCFLDTIWFFGWQIFIKLKAEKHSGGHTTIYTTDAKHNTDWELLHFKWASQYMLGNLNFLIENFFSFLFFSFWSCLVEPHIINLRIKWIDCETIIRKIIILR
jgi:hypothetical protein